MEIKLPFKNNVKNKNYKMFFNKKNWTKSNRFNKILRNLLLFFKKSP